MRASKEHMQKVRKHILDAAAKGFREEGYGGLGINGLAKRAGMTSGAFYGHFASKDEAFQSVVQTGLDDYQQTIEQFQQQDEQHWVQHFLDYYLGNEHVHDVAHSCVVPGLSGDVIRASEQTKTIYAESIQQISQGIANGMQGKQKSDVLPLIALLAGSVMMARSVADKDLADDILISARKWADKMVQD